MLHSTYVRNSERERERESARKERKEPEKTKSHSLNALRYNIHFVGTSSLQQQQQQQIRSQNVGYRVDITQNICNKMLE